MKTPEILSLVIKFGVINKDRAVKMASVENNLKYLHIQFI